MNQSKHQAKPSLFLVSACAPAILISGLGPRQWQSHVLLSLRKTLLSLIKPLFFLKSAQKKRELRNLFNIGYEYILFCLVICLGNKIIANTCLESLINNSNVNVEHAANRTATQVEVFFQSKNKGLPAIMSLMTHPSRKMLSIYVVF